MTKAIAIVSGGLDSVTLAYDILDHGYSLHMLTFNYGQRHVREIQSAQIIAKRLGVKHSIVDLTSVGSLLGGSALTSRDIPVPDGHYAEESMRATVVPNRNAIMLTVAYGAAIAEGAQIVGTAVHAGDHFIYPDCRPAFLWAFEEMQRRATEGFGNPALYTPFVMATKAEIVGRGAVLGVPFQDTWSCYKGGQFHCGTCGTCTERIEAFRDARVEDPTVYFPGVADVHHQ